MYSVQPLCVLGILGGLKIQHPYAFGFAGYDKGSSTINIQDLTIMGWHRQERESRDSYNGARYSARGKDGVYTAALAVLLPWLSSHSRKEPLT